MTNLKLDVKLQIGLWIVVAISVLTYFAGKQISQGQIQAFLESTGPWAPIVWILLHQLSYVMAPISGTPFLIAGFYLFGEKTIFYNYIVVIVGSSFNFLIAKKWGRPIVGKLAGQETLDKIDKFEKEYGLKTLFLLRMFLIGLGDFISYAYGLTPIKYTTFIGISAIAMIPGYILWYFFANKTGNIEQFLGVSFGLTFVASGFFFAGNYLYKKYFKRSK